MEPKTGRSLIPPSPCSNIRNIPTMCFDFLVDYIPHITISRYMSYFLGI